MPSNDVIKGPQAEPARSASLPGSRSAGADPAPATAALATPASEGDTGVDGQACAFNRWCTVLY
ncbi:hypothetical protein [Streptomyces spectabilis]|uniref:Uncharacterized protein n=1 Tax=Streptomyces spectabilis TaxID=68270 RepID=A0A516R2E0_STRST|nr:hypothetical protein [Streptomyces spectabilis]QDQ09828.1 hypothetical protein FH965_04015 [Streptomyces spectabilis]